MLDLTYYPKRHMAPSPREGTNSWQNDGQNFIYDRTNKQWVTWALANPDWKQGDGFAKTGWMKYAGPTIDTMKPVALWGENNDQTFVSRFSSLSGSWWSGSVYVDYDNNLKRGAGKVYYYISGQNPTIQGISVLVADDLDSHPKRLGSVVSVPMAPFTTIDSGNDLRDCRVFWDADHSQLVMSCAAGKYFLFFRSYDGVTWTYLSALYGLTDTSGSAYNTIVECPNVVRLPVYNADGSLSSDKQWAIIGAAQLQFAQGTDAPECCTYWLGDWDGKTFTPDMPAYPLPLDWGSDSYASVAGTSDEGYVYFGYWMSEWSYTLQENPYDGFQNIQGFPRSVWVQKDSKGNRQVMTFPANQPTSKSITYKTATLQAGQVIDNAGFATSQCYRLDILLTKQNGAWPEEIDIKLAYGLYQGVYRYSLLKITPSLVTLQRDNAGTVKLGDGVNDPQSIWNKPYSVHSDVVDVMDGDTLPITVLLDTSSTEVFLGDGRAALAQISFPPDGCTGFQITSSSAVSVGLATSSY